MLRRSLLVASLALGSLHVPLTGQEQDPGDVIAAAVLPLPETLQSGAAVVGGDESGTTFELRSGSNGIICRRDFPLPAAAGAFVAVCYQGSMHAFVSRTVELTAGGLSREEIGRKLTDEAKSGELEIPTTPVAGYLMIGSGYDASTNAVSDPFRWQVLFSPFMTAAEAGLPDHEVAGMPWMMNSGTVRAHIMMPTPDGP